jgi:NADPH:quinone reductase-like Zn-dependent oxidoreductase
MRKVVIDRPGSYAALRVVELAADHPAAVAVPGPGDVVVEVEAIGVNYADVIVRMGLYASARQLHGYPITPGFEAAGRVIALGAGVDGFALGERVIVLTLFGAYASRLCIPVQRVFACPARLDAVQAAAVPTVFLTAWFMVHQQVHPRGGERWLVHSAAGGVGGALAQLGRLAGVDVTGVVGGAHKVEAARAAGCTQVIDKSTQPLWPSATRIAPDGFDAIFDANGVSTLGASYAHLAPMGKLVVYGFASMLPRTGGRPNWPRLAWDWLRTPRFDPLRMTQENRSVMACNLSFLSANAERLAEGMHWLLARFERGELAPPPVQAYPLAQVAQAHREIESGRTVGKLVLLP